MSQTPLQELRDTINGDQQALLMIPGPTEFSPNVVAALAEKTLSHVSPAFTTIFGRALTDLRAVFQSGDDSNAYIISGSGSLGWEFIAANFVNPGDKALVLSAGYFGTSFTNVLNVYQADVEEFGLDPLGLNSPSVKVLRELEAVEENRQALTEEQRKQRADALETRQTELNEQLTAIAEKVKQLKPKIVCMTHVDTSTSYRTPVKEIIDAIKAAVPEADVPLFAVDGVCSVAGERFLVKDWGVDLAFTGSQKALGVPPGLMLMVESKKAEGLRNPKESVRSYYCNMYNWQPIMQSYADGKPKYFATPAVNLIYSLFVGQRQLLRAAPGGSEQPESEVEAKVEDTTMRGVWSRHQKSAEQVWRALKTMRFKMLVPDASRRATTLSAFTLGSARGNSQYVDLFRTALRYPSRGQDLNKVVLAGGLLKDLPAELGTYFRFGHMGVSSFHRSTYNHLQSTVRTISHAIQTSFPQGQPSSLTEEERSAAIRALDIH